MTHCAWTQVVDDPAARHLVAVRLEPRAVDEPVVLMSALIEGLAPAGDFALVTRCEEECAVMMCAFSHPTDALALASAVDAQQTNRYPEWGSQRCFTLDRCTAQAIANAIKVSHAPPPAQHEPLQFELRSVFSAPAPQYAYSRAA
jgi:hypothetical protein